MGGTSIFRESTMPFPIEVIANHHPAMKRAREKLGFMIGDSQD